VWTEYKCGSQALVCTAMYCELEKNLCYCNADQDKTKFAIMIRMFKMTNQATIKRQKKGYSSK